MFSRARVCACMCVCVFFQVSTSASSLVTYFMCVQRLKICVFPICWIWLQVILLYIACYVALRCISFPAEEKSPAFQTVRTDEPGSVSFVVCQVNYRRWGFITSLSIARNLSIVHLDTVIRIIDTDGLLRERRRFLQNCCRVSFEHQILLLLFLWRINRAHIARAQLDPKRQSQ